MTGTVIREVGGGRFEVRADDGRTFSVRSSASETRRVRTGDRVELVGYLTDRNTFVADSVRVIGQGSGDSNSNIDFYATVLSTSSNRLTVRADDGQTFTVNTRRAYSSSINRGDRVRVTGLSTNRNVVSSATVELVSNNGGTVGNNDTVDFNGTVISSDGRSLQVRGDNGRTYNVRVNNDSVFRRGERVRITGTTRNGIVYATGVGRL
jgi:archaellum component FlaF (FlaF/FlaG flagellin family)